MSEDTPNTQKVWRTLKRATETFGRLSEALQEKLHALSGHTGDPEVDAGQLTKDIIAHQGAWKMVQDALRKFNEDSREKGGVGKDGIDFGKAKEEVLRRVAGLVPKRTG